MAASRFAAALAAVAATASALDPQHAVDVTIYHVNQATYGTAPLNMDTADLNGDMYFDLRGVSEPLECAHPTPSTAHDCDNPEVTSTDLVITKLTLEVDDRFGNYGRCNVCVNGTDHHGNNSCTEGAYWCNCGGWNSKDTQCSSAVGRQNLTTWLGDRKCGRGSLLWDCWKDAVGQKTCVDSPEGGFWYSTTSSGYCGDDPSSNPPGCSWRVKNVIKRVNKTCSDQSIFSTVEKEGSDCFSTCGSPGAPRNTSSACWIKCFYATALGPDAGFPGGTIAGMPLDDLQRAWRAPFESTDPSQGGCPNLPE